MEFREKSGTSKRTFLMAAFALAMFFLGYFLLTPGQSALDTNGKVMDVLGDIRGRLDSLEDEIKDLRKKQAEEGAQLKLIGSLKLNGESNGQISLGNAAELNERLTILEQQVRSLNHLQGNTPRKEKSSIPPPPPPSLGVLPDIFHGPPTKMSQPALRKRVEQRIKVPRRSALDQERATEIKDAFVLAFTGYEKYCFGAGGNMLGQGMPFTMIDSLDTMLIMELDDMFLRNVDWLKTHFSWKLTSPSNQMVSTFEMTIRCLGGFLSAYHLSGDRYLLKQAIELANHIVKRFNKDTDLPYPKIYGPNSQSNLAEIGSIQLEFSFLANITGTQEYYDKALKIYSHLMANQPKGKIYPEGFDVNSPNVYNFNENRLHEEGHFGIGSAKDSFYEYILKYWIITGESNDKMKQWYYDTMDAVLDQLGRDIKEVDLRGKINSNNAQPKQTYRPNMWFITERDKSRMEHYVCLNDCAVLILGANATSNQATKLRHTNAAASISDFCHYIYTMNPTGLPCDAVRVDPNSGNVDCDVFEYHMRPEAVESWFYMYRLTGDKKYKEWAWDYFQSVQKHTKMENGYTGLRNAQMPSTTNETLKYLYLMFSDEVVDLSEYVFNTEAHMFPKFKEFAPLPNIPPQKSQSS